MKKSLLLLMSALCTMCITYAQNQGYSWTFGAAPPYTSAKAMTGSAGSYTLGLLGDDPSLLVHAAEPVGLGTSCPIATPFNVTEYGAGGSAFGVEFTNAGPQVVTTTYTIQMAVRFNSSGNFRRILGFDDLMTPAGDDGFYVTPNLGGPGDNLIVFRVGGVDSYDPANTPLLPDTWYFLTFTRNAAGIISVYINGVFDALYDDAAGNFIPKAANSNKINFLKDNDVLTDPNPYEEAGGKIAKLSVYNFEMQPGQVTRSYNNICSANFQLDAEGYQWTFAASPLTSVPAISTSAESHTLDALGGGPIILGVDETVGLVSGCAGLTDVGDYPTDFGLNFNNTPQLIYDTYTIELAIKLDDISGVSRKLFSFEDLSDVPGRGTYGVYVTTTGEIEFQDGASTVIPGSPIVAGNWYHLVFTRAWDGTISYYKNGALVGAYTDADADFVPHSNTGNSIIFFKDDDGTNETTGQIAKIALFATPLADFDVTERFRSMCNTALVILPVNLTNFTAAKNGGQVDLTWATASEQNNLGFEVERSSNGSDFTTIGFVSGNGTTTQESTYRFVDQAPLAGKNYYRLKQVDIDGKSTYSEVRSVEMDEVGQKIVLFPNPSRSSITIRNIKTGSQLAIYNTQGNLVFRKIANNYQELISLEKFATGVYLLQITDKQNNKQTIRFSKL